MNELALVIGSAGDDAAMDRALGALASVPGAPGCMRFERRPDGLFEPPTQPTRRITPTYVPCRVQSAFPEGGTLNELSGTLVLDTEYGDCVLNLVRDTRYDWIYVQVPPGVVGDADRWLVSTAEGLLARFPFRVGFLIGVGMDGPGTEIVEFAADYESHGLPPNRRCDYLCPDAGGTLIWHPA
jgi:hypothetical protein